MVLKAWSHLVDITAGRRCEVGGEQTTQNLRHEIDHDSRFWIID